MTFKFGSMKFGSMGGGGGGGGTGFLDDIVGLDVAFQVDATKTASYGGSGQTVANVIASPSDGELQADYDFWLGTNSGVASDDPTFTGTAGNNAAYFAMDGGDWFTAKNAGLLATATAHQSSNLTDSWAVLVLRTTPTPSTQRYMSTSDGTTQGFRLSMISTDEANMVQRGNSATTTTVATTTSPITASTDLVLLTTWDSVGDVSKIYVNSDTPIITSNTAFVTATSPAPLPLVIGASASFAQALDADTRVYGAAFGQGLLTDALAAAIRQWYNDNHAQTY